MRLEAGGFKVKVQSLGSTEGSDAHAEHTDDDNERLRVEGVRFRAERKQVKPVLRTIRAFAVKVEGKRLPVSPFPDF